MSRFSDGEGNFSRSPALFGESHFSIFMGEIRERSPAGACTSAVNLFDEDSFGLALFVNAKYQDRYAFFPGHDRVDLFQGHDAGVAFFEYFFGFVFLPQNHGTLEDVGEFLTGVPVLGQGRVWRYGDMADDHFRAFDPLQLAG